MNLNMFENVRARRIDLKEAKRILNINGNMYSDEEVKKIVDFLYDFADLSAERLESNRKRVAGLTQLRCVLHRISMSPLES